MERDFNKFLINPEVSIRDAVRSIADGLEKIALVTDGNGRLLGTFVDGDMRRALLKGMSLDTAVKEVMNPNPKVCSIEDAIRLNVSAVAFSILVGQPFERDTILGFTQIIDEANRYGIPVLAVTAVGRGLGKDAKYLSLASRMAAELGASMVKTYYCKDFEKVVETCPVPIVIAGGKKIPEKDALEMAYNALQAGAIGVDMGRNIFQSTDPVGMIKAVNAVVHKKYTPKEAYELFKSNKKT